MDYFAVAILGWFIGILIPYTIKDSVDGILISTGIWLALFFIFGVTAGIKVVFGV